MHSNKSMYTFFVVVWSEIRTWNSQSVYPFTLEYLLSKYIIIYYTFGKTPLDSQRSNRATWLTQPSAVLNFFPALKGRKNEKNIFLSISWSKIKRKLYCVWILPNHLCSFFVREFKEESKKEGNVVPSGGHETQLLKYQVRPPGGALR